MAIQPTSPSPVSAIILAAGIGSRFGSDNPKCLQKLPNGTTIIQNQIQLLKNNGVSQILVVVGFKKELIIEANPDVLYFFNPHFRETNTSKSLLGALNAINPCNCIWLNGDVCLDDEVIKRIVVTPGNIVCVNTAACGDEEVKYRSSSAGAITEISKQVQQAEGEAVGVNKISRDDYTDFLHSLEICDDNDYFEKGIEISIGNGTTFTPIDVSDCKCIEVDFKDDYNRAKELFS